MILSNAANQCHTCLAQQIDLKSRLQAGPGGSEYTTIYQCRQCRRFKRTERHYESYEMESPELLALVLKQIPALSNNSKNKTPLTLVDAGFIWTEPHSMRLKLHITVRALIQGVVVQQRVMVQLRIQFLMCEDCNREYTNRTWQALVQIRQKHTSKKGLAALEVQLAQNPKHVRQHVVGMDAVANGFDFYFGGLTQAHSFANMCQTLAPMRVSINKKMVSADATNNTANVKTTIALDMVPLCRHDLVAVHKSARRAKLAGRLVLVEKVSSTIQFVDASPTRRLSDLAMELSAEAYYKTEKLYLLVYSSQRMTRFVVLNVELCDPANDQVESRVEKFTLADVQVARESDFGANNEMCTCVSHLGHLLQPGDVVLGYDLTASSGEFDERLGSNYVVPDVVLVQKIAGGGQVEKSKEELGDVDGYNKISKKKDRRRRRHEGKRSKALEESAIRMGFIEEEPMDSKMAFNVPILDEQLSALQRDLESLAHTDGNNLQEESRSVM
jgi:nonsense-mediated mRNA decay protein 3